MCVAGTLAGCATPYPLVALRPVSREVTWVAGRAVTYKDQRGIRVAAAFERQQGDNLEIRVEIQNATGAALDVVPHEFTFTTCLTTDVGSCRPTRFIIDPEKVLADLDATQSRAAASAANNQAVLGGLVLLTAVADAGSIASGRGDASAGTNTLATAAVLNEDRTRADLTAASIDNQRAVWSNVALRRNTVFPQRGVAGDIFVPVDREARLVWIHVRAAGEVFSFPFRQTVTSLDPHPAVISLSN